MAEPVEQLDLLLAVPPRRMILGESCDQLADTRAELVREVGCGRADELVDLLDDRVSHA
jgi:hypothetical protein